MRTLRIFISSPGDVAEERDKAKQVITDLQRRYDGQATLMPVLWEDLPITATSPFQVGIEDQIIKSIKIDVAVFILWSKLGSPTGPSITKSDGTPYLSGTEREFDLMLAAFERSGGKSPLIFAYTRRDDEAFSHRLDATKQDDDALEELIKQRKLVKRFISERFQDKDGHNLRAYHSYSEPAAFAQRLQIHLSGAIDGLLGLDYSALSEPPSRSLEQHSTKAVANLSEVVRDERTSPHSRDVLLPVTNTKEITVSLEGPANFRSISEAVEQVSDGGIIRIRAGHYQDAFVIKRPVTLLGDGCENVTIQAIGSRVISVVNATVVFRGITFHSIKPGDDANKDEDVCLKSAVSCEQSFISADVCRFICDGFHSLALRGTATAATIRSCQLKDDHGCYLSGSVSATFEKCDFTSKWSGIFGTANSHSHLVDSNIDSDGARLENEAECHWVRCRAKFGKYGGFDCLNNSVLKLDASEITAPGGGLRFYDSSSGSVVNSSLTGGEPIISLSGTAMVDVTDTHIASDRNGTAIFCHESSEFRMLRGSVQGDRGLSLSDKSEARCREVQFTGSGKDAVGFSPSDKAEARLEKCVFKGFKNGAMISGSGNTRITNSKFIGSGEKYTNGIVIYEDNNAIVESCEISGYGGKGVSISDNSECKIRDSRIHGNEVGVSSDSTGKPTISGCDLRGNLRGAFKVEEGCRVRDLDNLE